MDVNSMVAKIYAKRLAAGLVLSFDRTDADAQERLGRATAAYATREERDQEFDRLTWLGRNPRIEQ